MSFIGSYLEGEKARKDGLKPEDNPYQGRAENGYDEWTRRENERWWNGGYSDATEDNQTKEDENKSDN